MLVKNKYLDFKSHTFVFMFNAKYHVSPVGISWSSHVYTDTDWHCVINMISIVITCQDGVLQVVPVSMFRKISQVFGWKFQFSSFHCVLKLTLERARQLRILTKRLHFYHDLGSNDFPPSSSRSRISIIISLVSRQEFHLFIRSSVLAPHLEGLGLVSPPR